MFTNVRFLSFYYSCTWCTWIDRCVFWVFFLLILPHKRMAGLEFLFQKISQPPAVSDCCSPDGLACCPVFLTTSSMWQVTRLAFAIANPMEEAQPGDLPSRGGQHVLGTSVSLTQPRPCSELLFWITHGAPSVLYFISVGRRCRTQVEEELSVYCRV